ncbi:hypothetical protein C8J57DRAFT_555086 [Mycena rebaudengoi]|nr:hypothetical protein C8J57DRAFT_555086 [Mycena rebaudengoi]
MRDMHPTPDTQILGVLSSRCTPATPGHAVPEDECNAEADILGFQSARSLSLPDRTRRRAEAHSRTTRHPRLGTLRRLVCFLLRARRRCTERRAFVGGWVGGWWWARVACRAPPQGGCGRGRRGEAPSPCARTLSEASRKGKSRCGLAGGDGGQEVLGIRHLDVEVDEDVELGILLLLVLVLIYPTPVVKGSRESQVWVKEWRVVT